MIERNISSSILRALSDTPVVLLNGARQTGKTTLVKWLAQAKHPARFVTLDDATVLSAALEDPVGFLAGLEGPVILDEIQRAPELFPAIKAEVDRRRQPGRFLLTGSANVLLLPRLSESLVGRMEILTLWPLSQGELKGAKESFIDRAFSGKVPQLVEAQDRHELIRRVLTGGYPETITRKSVDRRKAWMGSYVTTILHRDIRDLANIEHLTALPRLLSLLAARTTSLLNYAEISNSLGLPQTTLKRYMALLEATFLLQLVPAWSANLGKRLVRSPKITLDDTGLMAYLLGIEEQRIEVDSTVFGSLLENFVIMELRKQIAWSHKQPRIYHFRTQGGQEVDIILEDAAGDVVGIEVKATSSVIAKAFSGLRYLSDVLGKRFVRGIVLYSGNEVVSFAPKLHALPINSLWSR